jgi:hypothetical protein
LCGFSPPHFGPPKIGYRTVKSYWKLLDKIEERRTMGIVELSKIILAIILPVNLFSCIKGKNDTQNMEYKIFNIDFEKDREIIENYFVNEVLNGIKYTGRLDDKNGAVKFYGLPLEENIESIPPYYLEGYYAIAIRKLIYDDLIHYYYVFETGKELYAGVEMNKSQKRLKTINIGDDVNKLKETFGRNFYEHENIISYYGLNEEVAFFVEKDIIVKIIGSYLLI